MCASALGNQKRALPGVSVNLDGGWFQGTAACVIVLSDMPEVEWRAHFRQISLVDAHFHSWPIPGTQARYQHIGHSLLLFLELCHMSRHVAA